MKRYKLTSYATGLTIAEDYFESTADAWMTLSKLSSDSVIAVLWAYNKEVPLLLNGEKVIKAYTEKYGENPHGIAPIEYYMPFCMGLTGDDFYSKKITIDLEDQSFIKVGNDPNKIMYVPPKERSKYDNRTDDQLDKTMDDSMSFQDEKDKCGTDVRRRYQESKFKNK
ncbi:MAG: hypothetical protein PEPC_01736 [Peptostreptococcus russellii]